jgi:hypothetical protein
MKINNAKEFVVLISISSVIQASCTLAKHGTGALSKVRLDSILGGAEERLDPQQGECRHFRCPQREDIVFIHQQQGPGRVCPHRQFRSAGAAAAKNQRVLIS